VTPGGLVAARPEPRVVPPRASSTEDVLRDRLAESAERLAALDLPAPHLEGKLLRPLFALAMVPADLWSTLDERFWNGALAIQMVHEASLLHDDVLDAAVERRGRPTVVAEHGLGRALVLGDHYLTASYRAAAATGSFEFLTLFAEAVERTVAGEIAQGTAAGSVLTLPEYDAAILGKSGALFGAAAALGSTVGSVGETRLRLGIGSRFGGLYQRIDDLLDYCTRAETGKPPLQDYRQGKWSWVLDLAGVTSFELEDDEVAKAIFGRRLDGSSAARDALGLLDDGQRDLLAHAVRAGADECTLGGLLRQWMDVASRAVSDEEVALGYARSTPGTTIPNRREGIEAPADLAQAESHVRQQAEGLGGPGEWAAYFGAHARTFHLAARLFPPREAELVAGLYAYCRFSDDLVDDPQDQPDRATLILRLEAWRRLSLDAFSGTETGIPLLDSVMFEARAQGVSERYPTALLDGIAMDLEPRRPATWEELERYTFGVAGAVGGWMTQLFGLHDPHLLERAHALGHGMQLTNIARDVGEDWQRGRVYLPDELLSAHGVTPSEIGAMVGQTRPVSKAYRSLVEELLARADAYYEVAWPGIRALPPFFRRPVAAAASAYRGIHREIRRNDFDNLTRRACTSTARKILLAGAGLLDARRAS
jgi:phytoene synthase